MRLWAEGCILDLLDEGCTIQQQTFKGSSVYRISQQFLVQDYLQSECSKECQSAFQLLEERCSDILGKDDTPASGEYVSDAKE